MDASSLFFFAKSSPKFHISKEETVAIKVLWIMHWSCLYYLSMLCHRKTQIANSVIQPGLWTKTPISQSSQYAAAPLLSAYYPCRTHSLIYDNTHSHNSPLCVPPPPPLASFRNQRPRLRMRKTAAYRLHGLFSFNDRISWLPRY